MTDLEALKAYRFVLVEANALAEQVAELQDLPKEVQSVELADLQARLKAQQNLLEQISHQAETVIEAQASPRTRMVLRHYYLVGRSDDKVALVSGLCPKTVNRIRNRFLHDWAIVEEARKKHGNK